MNVQTSNAAAGLSDGQSPRWILRGGILIGWALLFVFVIWTALLGRIGADVRSFQAAYLIGFAGYIVLLMIVVRTGRAVSLGRWRWWVLGCAALRIIPLWVEPGDDANRYLWEGRVQLAGFDPYVHAPNDPVLADLRDKEWEQINHPDFPAVYPPLAQWEFLAAAAIHPSKETLKILHALWDLLALVALGAALRRSGRPCHLAIVYGLCPLVISAFAIEGHVDSLMLLCVVVGMWMIDERRTTLAGVAFGLAVLAKTNAVVFLPWVIFRHWRAAVVSAVTITLCYALYGGDALGGLSNLRRFGAAGEVYSLAKSMWITDFPGGNSRWIAGVSVVAMVLVLAWRRRDGWWFGFGATSVLIMFSPIVHYWYFAWVLVFSPFCIRARWIAAAAGMVLYFEAELHRSTTGEWFIPLWAPRVTWLMFLSAWAVEVVVERRRRRLAAS